MEINEHSLGQLRNLLLNVLSPDNTMRKEAERAITAIEGQHGFCLLVLQLVNLLSQSISKEDIAIRQSASVLLKNVIKKLWQPEDDNKENAIADSDREVLKMHLVNLMCTTPPDVQKQLAESVSIISTYDFPSKWQTLLPQLVQKLETKDLTVIKGVMLTANSIMKRFRYAMGNDSLYSDLSTCLKQFQAPLLSTYLYCGSLVELYAQDKAQLIIVLETLRLMTRIYFSLNWQDIPEFFEDNIAVWMTEFAKYMNYTNPLLIDPREKNEPGIIDKLQAAIVESLVLYVTKYEEEFAPHLQHFTQAIWQLLLQVGPYPKFDVLATFAIKFLTSVCSKQMNAHLFNEEILRQIVEQIVVVNLTSSEADEELFEDNPTDYIQKDMEGSDQDTRRRCACELVRALLKFFPVQISQLCLGYIGHKLIEYQQTQSWRAKDTALNLVLAVAVMTTSTGQGAGELNTHVNILDIFTTHVLPEVHDSNVNANPIVKADAIKLICLFRSHLNAEFMLGLIPHLIRHLNSTYVVVQTYAAMCIERFLFVKDRDPATNKMLPRVTRQVISPVLLDLFNGLFCVLVNPDLPENDYVMKCIMRVLVLVDVDIAPVIELVLQQLTSTLERVCKNPANPHFNHYLFECLAVLVRSCCSSTSSALNPTAASARLEELLFPPFQAVLSQDVAEFVPYVFQILAQLLYYRPRLVEGSAGGGGLSPAYLALFPPLLSPVLWERKGNVPALIVLFRAYILRGIAEIVKGGHLPAVLGIFQKMLSSKVNEAHGFALMDALVLTTPYAAIEQYVRTVFELILRRLMENKTIHYMKLVVHFFCLFAMVYGPQSMFQILEGIQPGMTAMIVTDVLPKSIDACANCDNLMIQHMTVGGTRILFETPISQNDNSIRAMIVFLITLLSGESTTTGVRGGLESGLSIDDKIDEGSREFDSTYSRLAYAQIPDPEATSQMNQSPLFFATSLSTASRSMPGKYSMVIQNCLDDVQKQYLQNLLIKAGVQLS